MKCKVLLVGEGPSDIGDLADQPSYREGRDGFLQPLLRKMVGEDVDLEFDGCKLMHLPKKPLGKSNAGRLQAKNASRALAMASAGGMNALVLAFDTDKSPGDPAKRIERKRRLHLLRASAERGFAHEREHDEAAETIQTVIAVPCRMIEAWALGDRKALADLLDLPAESLDYDEPEELWGDEDDESSGHPKRVWRRVTEKRIDFAEIGAKAAPSTLAKTCPDSFPPFADDVDRALRRCAAGSASSTSSRKPKRKR